MKTSLRATAFAALLFLLPHSWALAPEQASATVAQWSNPSALSRLKGERAAIPRFWKILAALEDGRRGGQLPSKTMDEALRLTGDTGAHGLLVKERLLVAYETAGRAALFNDTNLVRMRTGRSPLSVGGSDHGVPCEADHVLPVVEFPSLGNELANLVVLTRESNRRKSAEIRQRAMDLGQKFVAAGVIAPAELERLKKMR